MGGKRGVVWFFQFFWSGLLHNQMTLAPCLGCKNRLQGLRCAGQTFVWTGDDDATLLDCNCQVKQNTPGRAVTRSFSRHLPEEVAGAEQDVLLLHDAQDAKLEGCCNIERAPVTLRAVFDFWCCHWVDVNQLPRLRCDLLQEHVLMVGVHPEDDVHLLSDSCRTEIHGGSSAARHNGGIAAANHASCEGNWVVPVRKVFLRDSENCLHTVGAEESAAAFGGIFDAACLEVAMGRFLLFAVQMRQCLGMVGSGKECCHGFAGCLLLDYWLFMKPTSTIIVLRRVQKGHRLFYRAYIPFCTRFKYERN